MSVGRLVRRLGLSCVLATVAATGTGCTVEISPGADAAAGIPSTAAAGPSLADTSGGPSLADTSAEDLLPDTRFVPEGYTAQIVPAAGRASVIGTVTGIPVGSTVDPSACAPQPLAADAAVLLATDATGGRLLVVVERVDARLQHLVEQWRNCGGFTVLDGSTTLTHTTEVTAAPPVGTDESAGLRTSIEGSPGGVVLRTVTLTAQHGAYRATAVGEGSVGTVDTVGLDALFTETALNLRNS